MALAQAGDLTAFDQLVRRHGERLFNVAYRVLGSREDAEDAVQDAFVQAWRGLDRFRQDSAFSTWLYRICVNRCLRVLAARRDHDEIPPDLVDPALAPDEAVGLHLDVRAVLATLAALPEHQRVAVALVDFAGFTYAEAAEVVDASMTAVRSRVFRGRSAILRQVTSGSDRRRGPLPKEPAHG